jgi:hypothetical protein
MKRLGIVALFSVVLCSGLGCGGPKYLSSSLDDWYAGKYSQSPWIYGNTLSYGLYSFVDGFALMVDSIFVNPFFFWFKDAKPFGDDKGTTFEHQSPPGKNVKS